MLLHVFFGSLPPLGSKPISFPSWLPFTGAYMVGLFFVVSGFALSISFLQDNDRKRLLRMTGGRYVRLMVPIFATCALASICLNTGIIPAPAARLPAYATSYAFDPTLGHLLWFSTWAVFFNFDFGNTYAGPLWTMAYELIGSYSIFALLLLVKQVAVRRSLCLCIGVYLFMKESVYCYFFFGVMAAELYVWLQNRENLDAYAAKLAWVFLAAGFYLPSSHTPKAVLAGVICWFVGTMLSPTMRRLMSARLSRFLGEISFPLYLVHETMIVAVGGPIYVAADSSVGKLMAGVAAATASILIARAALPVETGSKKAASWVGRLVADAVEMIWSRARRRVETSAPT